MTSQKTLIIKSIFQKQDELSVLIGQVESKKQELEELQDRTTRENEKVLNLTHEKKTISDAIFDARNELRVIIQTLTEQKNTQLRENTQVTEEVIGIQSDFNEALKTIDDLISSKSTELYYSQQELNHYNEEKSRIIHELTNLKNSIQSLNSKNLLLSNKVAKKQEEYQELEAKIDSIHTAIKQLEQKEQDLDILTERLKGLYAELNLTFNL